MRSIGIEVSETFAQDAQQKQQAGSSSIFVAQNRQLAGVFFLTDQLRDETKPTLQALARFGYNLIMLTGDSRSVAERIARDLSITEVHSELLPEDKTNFIKELKASGKKVIMVGDGLNDAPALAEANVGIALGLRGIDVTLESAEVILINDNLALLPEIIRFSQKVFGIIRGDLYIATTVHIFTAMLVVYDVIGVLGSTIIHQCSATTVLLNTMRIFYIQDSK
jgi:Cd2+/Zn2+-exporting ATPase